MSGESEVAAGRCLLGVDLGGTRLRLLVERPDGDREPLVTTAAPGSYAELIETIALQARAAPVAVDAVGLGIPGTCHGSRAGFVPALPWLDGRDVGADLSARLAAEVTVANDAQLSLLAEARTGAARDADSAIMVTVGTGIGGAMMLGGRLWRGAHGSAGSWGWLDAAEAEPDAVHGPFEQVASGSALDALAGDIGGEDVVERARRGERGAQQIVETYARRLGRGLAGLCSALDPEVVVMAGGVVDALDVIGPVMNDERRRWSSPDGRGIRVVPAELGASAGVAGALEAARRGQEVWA